MSDALPFTGERFTPECVREIWYEHWHRYALAFRHARGRRVLDAACGEGFGSAWLATVARTVTAVDLDPATVSHARRRYGEREALRFVQGDVTALDPGLGPFDLIVSFETLEHVDAAAQQRMLAAFARCLAPGGVLLISSPDKLNYSDRRGYRNPFHQHELYRHELQALLSSHFACVELLSQQLLFLSVLHPVSSAPGAWTAGRLELDGRYDDGLDPEPMYYVAACAQSPEAVAPFVGRLDLFADHGQSIYRHYEAEIRKGIALAQVVEARDREIAALRQRLGE